MWNQSSGPASRILVASSLLSGAITVIFIPAAMHPSASPNVVWEGDAPELRFWGRCGAQSQPKRASGGLLYPYSPLKTPACSRSRRTTTKPPLSTHHQPCRVSCCPPSMTHAAEQLDLRRFCPWSVQAVAAAPMARIPRRQHGSILASHLLPLPLHHIADEISVSVCSQPLGVTSTVACVPTPPEDRPG